jgi:hypothetical protein
VTATLNPAGGWVAAYTAGSAVRAAAGFDVGPQGVASAAAVLTAQPDVRARRFRVLIASPPAPSSPIRTHGVLSRFR